MNFVSPSAITGKIAGQFFTPENIAKALVSWAVRLPTDLLLDPSCGDGAVLTHHGHVRGIERDPYSAWVARERVPQASIDNVDFFTWAQSTEERFECAAGNPPFIRFQNFKGNSKAAATAICEANGVSLSGLSSTWVPFLIGTAALLKPGGRMAFVVPAEIGHASYVGPLLDYLVGSFSAVQVVAVREKLFPWLSEDCWLLFCQGRGGKTDHIHFSRLDQFNGPSLPPIADAHRWPTLKRDWNGRLRPLLASQEARDAYLRAATTGAKRFGEFAKIGIGYVSGANDFFHLSPSQAAEYRIPPEYLVPTVRRGKSLSGNVISHDTLAEWRSSDESYLLLHIPLNADLPLEVVKYLETERGLDARRAYKCRVRSTWYSVPGVVRPDYFLQYMAGSQVRLSRNDAGAVCTNSVHGVRITDHAVAIASLPHWGNALSELSCELEGHPLGGGMLKLEPREASKILFGRACPAVQHFIAATEVLRKWRLGSVA